MLTTELKFYQSASLGGEVNHKCKKHVMDLYENVCSCLLDYVYMML